MFLWSIVFVTSTTLIFKFKKDTSLDCIENDHECKLGLIGSYKRLWEIVKRRPIQRISLIMMSCLVSRKILVILFRIISFLKIPLYCQCFFGPLNGVAPLKLMDAGVPRDKFVLTFLPTLPALCIFPFLLDRYLTKQKALGAFLRAVLCR